MTSYVLLAAHAAPYHALCIATAALSMLTMACVDTTLVCKIH
jgi:hypothetical protein